MALLSPLLHNNPSIPRLTVYDEVDGSRIEFSAQTLDNWANKVANMLDEEFELDAGATVVVDLPASWHAAVIALGAYASGHAPVFTPEGTTGDVVFTSPERAALWTEAEVAVVTRDPFGRGVEETGGTLPPGTVDFGPTVRFYGDTYDGPGPDISSWRDPTLGAQRYFIHPWATAADFERSVMAPLAAGGSVVIATGPLDDARARHIRAVENAEDLP
ncbi:hypothetical protein CAPI_02235 [Corynebacterium capitovis DSM 44611]|uniref:TIGR03089 family protein n=1 Tax=Corynebacterium capitovis TaxID=131081 RepID=UPI0003671910|nr:TIGR03089 family protein [Corynebacterium capitovis]WKD57021.1 hypothetical protein CAPI_02235 [Corynebacterium capitovis DSM 44611]